MYEERAMAGKCYAYAQDDLNLRSLNMFEGTFSLEAAHLAILNFICQTVSLCIKVFLQCVAILYQTDLRMKDTVVCERANWGPGIIRKIIYGT